MTHELSPRALDPIGRLPVCVDAERLSRLLEQTTRAARVGGWELDCQTSQLYWTAETYHIHEVSPDKYHPTVETAIAFYAPASVPIITEAVRRSLAEGVGYDLELQLITARGTRIWVRSIGVVERVGQEPIRLYGSFQDITHRKQADDALKRSELRAQQLLAASPDCLLELDQAGRVLSINTRGLELLQLSRAEDVLGRSWPELWSEQGREAVESALAEARAGRPARFQSAHPTLRGAMRWWDVHVAAIDNLAGQPDRLLVAARDITLWQQAQEEQQRFERNLLETQKLESLGVLAGGIAHDFNNLLTGIMGNTELVLLGTAADSPDVPYLEQVLHASERAADLCRQMLAYAGKGRFVVGPVDLSALVNDTMRLLQMTISRKATLTLCLAENLPAIHGDATQLRQVLMNLVINASEALGDGEGMVAVSTRLCAVDGNLLEGRNPCGGEERPEGEYVCLEVSDTGSGMDEATRARIFEPFFTTRFTGRGLGLAAVLGIVRSHGGLLHVHSKLEEGSTFQLFFPPCQEQVQPALRGISGTSRQCQRNGHGTILVVDDEDGVLETVCSGCRRLGFDVLQARDGREALRKLTQHGCARVRLVLLDWIMPRLDGRETLREIRRLAPRLPVVLMSGYSERELAERFAGQNVAGFLQKPFTLETMRERLCDALNE